LLGYLQKCGFNCLFEREDRGCPIEQWLRLKLPGYFRIVGIHGLGSGPRIWWPVVAPVSPRDPPLHHAARTCKRTILQQRSSRICRSGEILLVARSCRVSFQQGTEDRMIGIWEDYNMNINCLVVWNIFLHTLGIVTPTDELIFFRGVQTTNQ